MSAHASTSGTNTTSHKAGDPVCTPEATSLSDHSDKMAPSALPQAQTSNSIHVGEPTVLSQQESTPTPWHEVTIAHKNLLREVGKEGFDPGKIHVGENKLLEIGESEYSILHLMAQDWRVKLEPIFSVVMTMISQHNPKFYLLKDDSGKTILTCGRTLEIRKTFVKFFFKNYRPEAIELVKDNPPLLMALLSTWREVKWSRICRELQEFLIERAKDKHGNTFLHRVVRFPLESRSADDGELVEAIVKAVIDAEPRTLFALNDDGKSVYQCCLEAANESYAASESAVSVRKLGDSEDESNHTSDSNTPGINTPDSSTFSDTSDNDTSDDDDDMSDKYTGDGKPVEPISVVLLRVSNMLKKQIVRLGDSVERIRYLISAENKGLDIDLDFSEIGTIKNSRALRRHVEPLKLQVEGLLRNVKVPANETENNKDLRVRQEAITNFFEYLKAKHNMQRIMCLEVDELIGHPCSDALIESALRGIQIDTLDWKKTDMCAQVVANAVPGVRCLRLYCSKNPGSLSSWSAPDVLSKLPNLKRITLTVLEDQGIPQECIMNYAEFCRSLGENNLQGEDPSIRPSLSRMNNNNRQSWIRRLEDFCELINKHIDCNKLGDLAPRVAIIDDGVDLDELERSCVVKGRSFIPGAQWSLSTTGRGTTIARIISSLSPNSRIIVARTDTGIGSGEKSITEALKWCISERANIICFGTKIGIWPLGKKPEYSIVHDLEQTMRQASNRDIILFMPTWQRSTEDPTMQTIEPVRNVLNIATSQWCESGELPIDPEADFTLMDEIPTELRKGDAKGTLEAANGNFVSTAIAAGLAASILVCASDHPDPSKLFSGWGMTNVFWRLKGSGNSKMIMTANLAILTSKFHSIDALADHLVHIRIRY
ncbi:hypothetical protein O1611_g4591 [Lasiodiplodia mahajangana]|uniref:Uncharacterized protein n=1 Tax=Lasiodiplodia mahajangana TaxID=1108764 RepID=A0ACC2JNJ4_9PEZI|nr:hypothetical protein O1611_g4591 [Lasiodiplodia mahajangana]